MREYESMGGDCMCWSRKRWHRGRFGILLIVIGLLWFAQRAGWFTSEIFGPLVLLTLGVWMIATSYFHKRQGSPFLHASPLSCCGSQFRPDGDEATHQDQAAADKMLRPEGLSEQNYP